VLFRSDPILQADDVIRGAAPSLWAALSPLGRRLRQPANFLPLQSAEARGKPFNATIGQITDGKGTAVPLPSMAAALAGLEAKEASQSFLYSPVEGLAVLRRAYRDFQRRGVPESTPSTLPLVTDGVVHARGLALQMVVPAGRTVIGIGEAEPALRELVETRLGGRWVDLGAAPGGGELARSASTLPAGEPVVVAISAAAAPAEQGAIEADLLDLAAGRPVVVTIDDRWQPREGGDSLFWRLAGRADRPETLIPVQLDGTEGSWGFGGARVGFLTFAYPEGGGLALALESKLKMLLRAEVGSPSAFAQTQILKLLESHAAA
jgi:hypothetical protein